MPEHGVAWKPRDEILTFEEIEHLVRFFVRHGVRKVRLTGGEPTVRHGYLDLVARLAGIPGLESLALTTNGSLLARDASELKQRGLATLNVSLDTLRDDRFEQITRRPGLSNVLRGIAAALDAGLATKVNVVPLPGINDDEILDFVEWARTTPLTIRFIEFMPFLENNWKPERVITSVEIRRRVAEKYDLLPVSAEPADVAREYTIDGFAGRLGFISSVSESFCAGCSRLRLTADGALKSCLFLPPAVSLRDLVRQDANDADLLAATRACLDGKWKEHPPMNNWRQRDNLTMVQIGG